MKPRMAWVAIATAAIIGACDSEVERSERELRAAESALEAAEPDLFPRLRDTFARLEAARQEAADRRERYANAGHDPEAEAATAAALEAAAPEEYADWTDMVAILDQEPYWITDARTIRLIGLRRNALAAAAPEAFASYVAASPFRKAENAALASTVGILLLLDRIDRLVDELQGREPVLLARWITARAAHGQAIAGAAP